MNSQVMNFNILRFIKLIKNMMSSSDHEFGPTRLEKMKVVARDDMCKGMWEVVLLLLAMCNHILSLQLSKFEAEKCLTRSDSFFSM